MTMLILVKLLVQMSITGVIIACYSLRGTNFVRVSPEMMLIYAFDDWWRMPLWALDFGGEGRRRGRQGWGKRLLVPKSRAEIEKNSFNFLMYKYIFPCEMKRCTWFFCQCVCVKEKANTLVEMEIKYIWVCTKDEEQERLYERIRSALDHFDLCIY